MKSAILNPLRFRDASKAPDYGTYWPHMDNITQRTMYMPGVHPNKQYYKEWLLGTTIYLQFERESTESVDLNIFKYDEDLFTYAEINTGSPVTGTDISPVGWTGNPIYEFVITISIAGTYYLEFDDNTLISDKFVIISDTNLSKQLVKIKYSNTENDFGCIFTGSHYFYQYYTGQLILGEPQNDISGFQSDRGDLIKLQATPIRIMNLLLNDIHYTYADNINMIFSVDTIEINGISFQNSEPPTKEDIGDSDLKNFVIKLIQTNNDYYSL